MKETSNSGRISGGRMVRSAASLAAASFRPNLVASISDGITIVRAVFAPRRGTPRRAHLPAADGSHRHASPDVEEVEPLGWISPDDVLEAEDPRACGILFAAAAHDDRVDDLDGVAAVAVEHAERRHQRHAHCARE